MSQPRNHRANHVALDSIKLKMHLVGEQKEAISIIVIVGCHLPRLLVLSRSELLDRARTFEYVSTLMSSLYRVTHFWTARYGKVVNNTGTSVG